MKSEAVRADLALVQRKLCRSRSLAQRLIRNAQVEYETLQGWQVLTRCNQSIPADLGLRVRPGAEQKFVSRAGNKLEALLQATGVAVSDLHALDIGQSTGGFTDCLLHYGAASVTGVDVGHGQLAESLRRDPRVICLEKTNARALPETLKPPGARQDQKFDLCSIDLSFISQTLVFSGLRNLITVQAPILSLVKPQFELGPKAIGRKGLVRPDPANEVRCRNKIEKALVQHEMRLAHWQACPLPGGDGNQEFLMLAYLS